MKKISFYINTLGKGGAERVVTVLSSEFLKMGYDVYVITSYMIDNEYELDNRIKRINLYENRICGKITRNIKYVAKLRDIYLKEKIDIALSFMAEANFRNIIATLGAKTKGYVSVRNDPTKEYPGVMLKFAKLLFSLSSGVFFQTAMAEEYFNNLPKEKSFIVKNPIDDRFFIQKDFNKQRHNIVSVGRLEKQKNHRMLVDAFKLVKDDFPDDNLHIYGEGSCKKDLQMYISKVGLNERVFLKGGISNVFDILDDYKIFVMTSDYEGLPNALMEAVVEGVPCISTDCPVGGPREIIKQGENGILVSVGDTETLAKSIKILLSDSFMRDKFSRNCIKNRMAYAKSRVAYNWNYFLVKQNND